MEDTVFMKAYFDKPPAWTSNPIDALGLFASDRMVFDGDRVILLTVIEGSMTVEADGVASTWKNSFLLVEKVEADKKTYWLVGANELHFLWCNPKVWKHVGVVSKEGHEPPVVLARPLFGMNGRKEAFDMAWALLTESSK